MHDDAGRGRLRTWWQAYIGSGPDANDRFDGVLAGYLENHRRYHDLAHLTAVIGTIVELAETEAVGDLGAVVAAGFYHDVIYDPLAGDNEERSAQRAERELAGLGWHSDRCRRIGAMVRATLSHDSGGSDPDTAVLLDADLAVLGREPATYAHYQRTVRAEYAESGVCDEAWSVGRASVLRQLLDHPRQFATETGRRRWESAARHNMATELADLTDN